MNDKRYGGQIPHPVRWDGVEYASKSEAIRQRYGLHCSLNGFYLRKFDEAVARGEAVLLPGPRPIDQSGAEGAARRLLRAAHEIQSVATAAQAEGGDTWTRVELRGRRRGLIKALHLYRQRFGVGVIDTLEGL